MKKENEAKWDKKALYFKIPKGKKLIGDSAYQGEPEKINIDRRTSVTHKRVFLPELNLGRRHFTQG